MLSFRGFLMVFLLASLSTAGCATSGTGGTSRNPDLITEAELVEVGNMSLHRAIERLRPSWLRSRATGSPPVVMMDGVRQGGGTDVLHQYQAHNILEVRHLSPSDATTRYGTGFSGGAIEVTTRR